MHWFMKYFVLPVWSVLSFYVTNMEGMYVLLSLLLVPGIGLLVYNFL